MRSKEDAQDYRYFPEPDLPPLVLDELRIKKIKETIPELPEEKIKRLQANFNLSPYESNLIASDVEIADFYEQAMTYAKEQSTSFAKMLANWMISDLFSYLNKESKSISESKVSAENLSSLVSLIKTEIISGKIAKDVLEIMWDTGKSPLIIIEERGMRQITSENEIEESLKDVLSVNKDKLEQYRSGKEKLFGFFIGEAMKKSGGKANPQLLNKILKKLLS
jgi:aspartyl-tRNA(Asn)/glutamyl-tRNA(Gln) amidotransferase subunit B